ncbi:MAG: amidohydrolase, partial [Acetatifactor sp.]|nr:amidohydrolase [Acetatifactor sp.]
DPYPGMLPSPHKNTVLAPADFVRLSRKHGIHKILFGTDSPWQDQGEYVERLRAIGLTAAEQEAVLGENAAKLLELPHATP